jgi:hypothetical protein
MHSQYINDLDFFIADLSATFEFSISPFAFSFSVLNLLKTTEYV